MANTGFFIDSKYIKFYPSGYRGKVKLHDSETSTDTWYSIDPESKLNTEENTSRVYNALIPFQYDDEHKAYGSLVLSKDYSWLKVKYDTQNNISDTFEFIIHGYYVKILNTTLVFANILSNNPDNVYAHIRIKAKGVPETSNPDNIYLSGKAVISSKDEPIVNNPEAGTTTNYSNLDYTVDNNIIFYGLELLTTTPSIKTKSDSDEYEDYYFKILTKGNLSTINGYDYVVPTASKLILSLDDIYGLEKDYGKVVSARDKLRSTKIISEYANINDLKVGSELHLGQHNNWTEYPSGTIKYNTDESGKNRLTFTRPHYYDFIHDGSNGLMISESTNNINNQKNCTQIYNSNISLWGNNNKTNINDSSIQITKNNNTIFDVSETGFKYNPDATYDINIASNSGISILSKDSNNSNLSSQIYLNKGDLKISGQKGTDIDVTGKYKYDITPYSAKLDYNRIASSTTIHKFIELYPNSSTDLGYTSCMLLGNESYSSGTFSKGQKLLLKSTGIGLYNGKDIDNNNLVFNLDSNGSLSAKNIQVSEKIRVDSVEVGASTSTTYPSINLKKESIESQYGLAVQRIDYAGANLVNCPVKANLFYASANSTDSNGVYTNGRVQANTFYATSDRRLKDHIEPIDYNKSILDLPVYTYTYKDSDTKQIGCMAQDLQKLYPELVSQDENGYLSVDNSKVVYLLLEEVKLLKKEIEDLKKSK